LTGVLACVLIQIHLFRLLRKCETTKSSQQVSHAPGRQKTLDLFAEI
jgi:hypothetical protein